MAALNHLTVPKLRSILKYHHISQFVTEDQLVIRVHLLRHNHSDAATAREERQLTDFIHLITNLLGSKNNLRQSTMYTEYVDTLPNKLEMAILSPFQITLEQRMIWVDYSTHYCHLEQCAERNNKQSVSYDYNPSKTIVSSNDATKERIAMVGSKVKVKWTAEEVKDSGWKAGWYTAIVHRYKMMRS